MSKALFTVEDREAARSILRYLVNNPQAKDTVEGIAHWWLEGEKGRRTSVERALSYLVAQGLVCETRRKGIPPFYQLRPRRRAAALRILREL